ncbi:MAG: YggS family pyridoxal phosphate-dependent enzyme [Deltaproteobacteria bacterium]|nr:MAG: YggS family pyridoxal phosphate-dependent enzyme [Deltaproteobacteria bacterium]
MALSFIEVAANLATVRERIEQAATRAGRDPLEVTLVAVSKMHPPEAIRAAHAAGHRVFGENYVQELVDKADALSDLDGLKFHFIGHLQRNKAKQVVRVGAVVETVSSPRLATALGTRAAAAGQTLDVYVQVNVGGEVQKSGCTVGDAPAVLDAVREHEGLILRGLMTVPPATDDPAEVRPFFARLRELRDELAPGLGLSMGMSRDLEIAVEEGATIVRVGTAIFGSR